MPMPLSAAEIIREPFPLRRADVHARGFLAVLQRVAGQVLKQHCEPAFVHGDRRQVFRADRSAGLFHLASKAL
jgi:hypothetical protein